MELVGKVTVVTGAAGGIGKALAEKFHQEGARVVLADLDEAALQLVAGPLNAKRPIALWFLPPTWAPKQQTPRL